MGCNQSSNNESVPTLTIPPEYVAILSKVPVFFSLSAEDIDKLAVHFTHTSYKANETVFKAGDTERALYVIAEGKVNITMVDPATGKDKQIASDESPGHFGEITLVHNDSVRTASVVAAGAGAILLKLSHAEWIKLTEEKWFKFTARKLRNAARHRQKNTLRKMKFLADLDEGTLSMLSSLFTMVSFRDGDKILGEGDPPKGFFILIEGNVNVTTKGGKKPILVSADSESNYFGEVALVEKIPTSATVRAKGGQALCLKLDANVFSTFLEMVSKEVRQKIAKTVKERATNMISPMVSDLVDPANVALGSELK
jgi:CRP-like cAMP-binding protein